MHKLKSLYFDVIIAILLIFGFAIILHTKAEKKYIKPPAEVLVEPAIIIDKIHISSVHNLSDPKSISFINIQDKYLLFLKCEHGNIVIDNKDFWKKFKVDDEVDVYYTEVLELSVLIDYDFIKMVKRIKIDG